MGRVPRVSHIPPALLPVILIMISLQCSGSSSQISSIQPGPRRQSRLVCTVVDENEVAIPSVQISLMRRSATQLEQARPIRGETDFAGRCEFKDIEPGVYELRAEKEDFYAFVQNDLRVGEAATLEITLNHREEFVQHVNVIYSPPTIDPAKTVSSETLTRGKIYLTTPPDVAKI